MEVLIPSYLTHSSSQTPNVTLILKSPGSDHQVVLPGLAPDARGYVHIQVECVFNLPPSIDDAPCQRMESSQGFSFSGMFSWATEGLKNRFFVSGNTTPPAHSGPPSEPYTETPQSQRVGPHGGPVIYANHHTGFLSSSPPPVRKLPNLLPSVNVRRSPPSTKDVASAVSLSSWAAANSIPFIYRNGEVFVPRRDNPSVEDHERRHELENILHPLLPPAPKQTAGKSAAPIAVQWLKSRHKSESRSSVDEVASNVAPAPASAQPVPVPTQPAPVLAQTIPVPVQPVPAQPQAVLAQPAPAQPQPVPATLPVQVPTLLSDRAPTPAVAVPSSALTRRREESEDSDPEEEARPRSRRRTQ